MLNIKDDEDNDKLYDIISNFSNLNYVMDSEYKQLFIGKSPADQYDDETLSEYKRRIRGLLEDKFHTPIDIEEIEFYHGVDDDGVISVD